MIVFPFYIFGSADPLINHLLRIALIILSRKSFRYQMKCCGPEEVSNPTSREIDKNLREEKRSRTKKIKLLLLGNFIFSMLLFISLFSLSPFSSGASHPIVSKGFAFYNF
jgi:hypothetical protein